MGTASFQRNTALRIAGKLYVMLRKVSDDLWQLEEAKTKRILETTDADLRALYSEGTLVFEGADDGVDDAMAGSPGSPNPSLSESQMSEAKVCRLYALAAIGVPTTKEALTRVAQSVWETLKSPPAIPNWSTVYRWRRNFLSADRDIHAVVPKISNRGNRKRRYPEEVLEFIEQAIDLKYMVRERGTIQDVLDKASFSVNKENKLRPSEAKLPLPTYQLVQSAVAAIPAFDRCLARHGRDVAIKRFRSMLGHRVTDAPLVRAEIDHTLLNLMVIDDNSGLPLGRPLLTACIDDYSRAVLGINIGFEPPSHLTVARCLKHTFMPKVSLNSQYAEIVNEWEAHGVMQELSMDNGAEFHSNSLEQACYSLGIEIHYSPRKTPWFKGKIERFQGTLNREVAHTAPGTTFADIFEKEDYDPVKHAVVRLSTLQHIVRKWIVDVYHERPHRSTKFPPAVMWKSSINREDIKLPEHPEQLDAILGRREERVLSHKGIELHGLFYNSPELTQLRMQLGEKLNVEVCVDDGDIGSVVVFSPDKKRMFVVPALALAYAKGLTAWQHKVCKRFAAKEMAKHDATGWLEAKERIAEMIQGEMKWKNSKAKASSRAARYLTGGKAAPVADTSKPNEPTGEPRTAMPSATVAPIPHSADFPVPTLNQAASSSPACFAPVVRRRA